MSRRRQAALLAALFAAVSGGYWLGQRQGTAAPAPAERKILYYRNPMGLPDTSPTPKKDPMGMDYLPVTAGEPSAPGSDSATEPGDPSVVRLSAGKIQTLGVRSVAAERRPLARQVRAPGRVETAEGRNYAVTAKFEGYVERLHVNASGQRVSKGQALFDVYSPELVSAQQEYLIARQGVARLAAGGDEARTGMRQLAEASLARLRNWDISDAQLQALRRSGTVQRTLTFRSPVSGVVTEKKAVPGMRFMPGESLYQISDLSTVWIIAEVFEQDIGLLRAGAMVRIRFDAYPERTFDGRIALISPTLKAETRTVPVRIELANPGQSLKPGMFAQVDLPAASVGAVLTVPNSAVIDSGRRQIVLIDSGEGRFTPREVRLGARDDEQVTVLDGLRAGERVVVAANFLIDAESNLRAALGAFGTPAGTAAAGSPGQASVVHRADGRVDDIDAQAGTLMVAHAPVASLNWPAMTMEFKTANAALLAGLQAGMAIRFEFVERAPGEWVITALSPAKPAAPPGAHAGH